MTIDLIARVEPAVRRMLQTSRQEVLDYVEFLLSKVSIDAERAAETGPARTRFGFRNLPSG